MKIRLRWADGGWESSDFQTNRDWYVAEWQEAEDVIDGDRSDISWEIEGGDILLRRVFYRWLELSDLSTDGAFSKERISEIFEGLWFFNSLSDYRQCDAYWYLQEQGETDLGSIEFTAGNTDYDDGYVLNTASNEDLDEAFYQLYLETIDEAPNFIQECISRDKAIAQAKKWNGYPIKSGGKWYVTTDKWNMRG